MAGEEECNSNESGWTKYIDPISEDEKPNSDIHHHHHHHHDDHAYHHPHHHHHHNQRYNKRKDEEDDDDDGYGKVGHGHGYHHEYDDSTSSDASSGPSHHDDDEHHHHHHGHGIKFFSSGKGKKSSKVIKEREPIFKTKKTSAYALKQRLGNKKN